MKVFLDASAFDVLPPQLLDGFQRAVAQAAIEWGVQAEVIRADSVQEAVNRFNAAVIEKDRLEAQKP